MSKFSITGYTSKTSADYTQFIGKFKHGNQVIREGKTTWTPQMQNALSSALNGSTINSASARTD